MISNNRIQRLFKYLVPYLGQRSSKELDAIYAEMQRILGYDSARAARYRRDAKERDDVVRSLVGMTISRGQQDTSSQNATGVYPAPQLSIPAYASESLM